MSVYVDDCGENKSESILQVPLLGTSVKIGKDIQAIIIGIAIYPRSVEYKVAWWNGRDRKEAWVNCVEVTQIQVARIIGFYNPQSLAPNP